MAQDTVPIEPIAGPEVPPLIAPPPKKRSWAKTTLYTGLGIMGVSVIGGAIGTGAVAARCGSANYQGHCFEAFVPIGLGGAGLALGGGTALVGGIGLLAMPRNGGGEVVLTARF